MESPGTTLSSASSTLTHLSPLNLRVSRMPILEGMAVGKAVISSDTSSMPEVGGDAVIYCNPYDRESIVNAIERVVEDEDYRKEMEQRAKKRAALFSYKKTAQQVLRVLEEVVNVK